MPQKRASLVLDWGMGGSGGHLGLVARRRSESAWIRSSFKDYVALDAVIVLGGNGACRVG